MSTTYRTSSRHHALDEANEQRADRIEIALTVATDRLGEAPDEDPSGTETDVSDLLASVRHFCDRAGLNYDAINDHAERAYEGDVASDGGTVERDEQRFPSW